MKTLVGSCALLLLVIGVAAGAEPSPGDVMVGKYFAAETAKLHHAPLDGIDSLKDWEAKRGEYRRQLQEMLGLYPWPEKHDLHVTVTGSHEREGIIVENLHFQSRPGLYVTANLYRPAKPQNDTKKFPAVLYVCGHGRVKIDGVSYGNKAAYQHHGAWLARNGFICLTIDSLELGEIEGVHKGTYSWKYPWWNNRGYTSAGVEAWNSIRALDLLEARDDVDAANLGVTGRSGGGAYSWWVAALDDRIKAAVPVAGVTDLENHVVDGVVEGHCDCMYWVNTYRHDYTLLPALVAPRALMIANTDSDSIFPLDGVNRTFFAARDIYQLYGKAKNLGLTIAPGPHKDIQQLQVPAFHWLRENLQGESPPIELAANKLFEPEELKVFDKLPEDQLNTEIHETFVPAAQPAEVPQSQDEWSEMRDHWKTQLQEKSLAGWPKSGGDLNLESSEPFERGNWKITRYAFTSQEHVRLPFLLFQQKSDSTAKSTRLIVADDAQWDTFVATLEEGVSSNSPLADAAEGEQILVLPPRGIGPTQWNQETKKNIQIQRRFLLLGQTLDGMRAWDILRAVESAKQIDNVPVTVEAQGTLAGVAVYAAIFQPKIDRLVLHDLPVDHRNGPILLNVRRFMNMPEAVAMVAENCAMTIQSGDPAAAEYAQKVGKVLEWGAESVQAPANGS